MKTWLRKYEWVQYALCVDSSIHTAEALTDAEVDAAAAICSACRVRPECMEWAVREKACSVVVAGVYLPDPMYRKELRAAYAELRRNLPAEFEARGSEA